jgi:hypothetical protein
MRSIPHGGKSEIRIPIAIGKKSEIRIPIAIGKNQKSEMRNEKREVRK